MLFTLNGYAHCDTEHIKTMLEDRDTMLGLADGGAHCSLICDASVYTSMLSYWARDRAAGTGAARAVVAKMTSVPAALYGFADRGVIEPGRRADLNVIDLDRLQLRPPEVAHDLPTGAARDRAAGRRLRAHVRGRRGRDRRRHRHRGPPRPPGAPPPLGLSAPERTASDRSPRGYGRPDDQFTRGFGLHGDCRTVGPLVDVTR